jgi:hypothetical protein
MKGMTREQGLRWTSYGLLVLVVLAGAYAGMLFLKADEAESAAAQARKATDEASASLAKAQTQLRTANARVTELEQKARELDTARALLGKLEPDVVPALEAAGKGGKPAARGAALATAGIIGQIVHGSKHEAALSALDRALAADKESCAAALARNRAGDKQLDVTPECQAILPVAAAAAPKPAAPAAAPAAAKAAEPDKK